MRIGFLITARLKSTRLPYKILKDLNGRTVIERIIDRAKEIKGISEIILCTSTHSQDKPLVDIARKNDIHFYCGSEEDVLQRLLDASKSFGLDYFLGITADNPLFSIDASNIIVNEIDTNEYDYIKVFGLPLGCATYGMRVKALETICKIKNRIDTEIWGPLIDRPDIFNIKTIEIPEESRKSDLRLTLDYQEDYELIRHLYEVLEYDKVIHLKDVLGYLEKNLEVGNINRHCEQMKLGDNDIDKIERYYRENRKRIMEMKDEIYNKK
ncbi:cytidylyltransferase domain-containing protein [Anaerosolibacter sp.]|uniref:cytidylyltransferase domain-containing protein n=1 Tax=Anaerosolibacter sp. TaxID=1872527 RepID=UPI0039EE13FD